MSERPKRRACELFPSAKKIGAEIADDIKASWLAPATATKTRKAPVDTSELARLKQLDERLADEELELAATTRAKREKVQAQIDELETEAYQQQWNDADVDDDTSDGADDDDFDLGVFDEDQPPAEQVDTSDMSPAAQAAFEAMSPEQQAAYLGKAA
jgi:hypothetical protein